MCDKYLIINAGSSSLKFSLYVLPEEKELVNGYVEKIGMEDSFYSLKYQGQKIKTECFIKDHGQAVSVMLQELINNNFISDISEIKGVGHRVLHGGEKYSDSVVIDETVLSDIVNLSNLGPLHHPGEIAGIIAMQKVLPKVTQVAVFDTAFHQTMPKENYMYPVPMKWYQKYGVRKYGFHGTSHKYITEEMKKKLNNNEPNLIICHIGSGASISAIKDGCCYDTSMGLTPLDGLMMGTRSGAIDPSILEYVCKETGKDITVITNELNKNSGYLGIAGVADCRDVEALAAAGNEDAILALNMYCDRIAKYIGQYYIELEGKIDAIVFTAGVGENSNTIRGSVIKRLECLSISLNKERNDKVAGYKEIQEAKISNDASKVEVYVVPTNEEVMILRDTYLLCNDIEKDKTKKLTK